MSRKFLFSFCLLMSTFLLLTACNDSDEKEEANSKPAEETKAPAEEEVDEVEEEEPEEERDAERLGDYEVYLGGEMVETKDKIMINGESNLLPGSRVIGEVIVEDDTVFADTSELVQEDGTFSMEIDHHDYGEETKVAVSFHFDGNQKDEIQRHYGERGQKLAGPFIYQHQREVGGRSRIDIYKQAKVEVTFEPEKELAVRQFTEPDWYEIPEDLGDPRVWIEVEEINNDKEFYYLHGRSNLLEGSKIKGEFSNNRDEARVMPDGSFDLKIDYEYREDTPFILTFKPADYQWNSVEEAYGKEGQKLIGDLVSVNKYNNRQFIEKEVGLESTDIQVPDNVDLTIDGTEVIMSVPDSVLFDFDKYDLKSDAKKTLTEINKTLKQFKEDVEIVINGHTDNVGKASYNLKLSEQRADEVKKFLSEDSALKNATFKTKGYGDKKPVASNDTEAGQAKNRRVEIVINLR